MNQPSPQPAPDLAELRRQLEAALRVYPQLRQGLTAALADIRRAQGEPVVTRQERRRNGLR